MAGPLKNILNERNRAFTLLVLFFTIGPAIAVISENTFGKFQGQLIVLAILILLVYLSRNKPESSSKYELAIFTPIDLHEKMKQVDEVLGTDDAINLGTLKKKQRIGFCFNIILGVLWALLTILTFYLFSLINLVVAIIGTLIVFHQIEKLYNLGLKRITRSLGLRCPNCDTEYMYYELLSRCALKNRCKECFKLIVNDNAIAPDCNASDDGRDGS